MDVRGQSWWLVFSFYPVGPGSYVHVVGLGSKHLYPLRGTPVSLLYYLFWDRVPCSLGWLWWVFLIVELATSRVNWNPRVWVHLWKTFLEQSVAVWRLPRSLIWATPSGGSLWRVWSRRLGVARSPSLLWRVHSLTDTVACFFGSLPYNEHQLSHRPHGLNSYRIPGLSIGDRHCWISWIL